MFGSARLGRGGRSAARGWGSWRGKGGQELGAEVEAKSQRLGDKEKVCSCKTQPRVVQFAVPSLPLHSVSLAGHRLGAGTEFRFPWGQGWGSGEKNRTERTLRQSSLEASRGSLAGSYKLFAKIEVSSGAAALTRYTGRRVGVTLGSTDAFRVPGLRVLQGTLVLESEPATEGLGTSHTHRAAASSSPPQGRSRRTLGEMVPVSGVGLGRGRAGEEKTSRRPSRRQGPGWLGGWNIRAHSNRCANSVRLRPRALSAGLLLGEQHERRPGDERHEHVHEHVGGRHGQRLG